MTSAIDRRIVRTRATLQHALIGLIMTRGYEAISVQDICAAANVGRSTFYAHYTGKDDLKRSGLDHLKTALKCDGVRGRLGFTPALFAHARDHLGLYRALQGGPGAEVSIASLRHVLTELVGDDLADIESRQVAAPFVVGALMSVLLWWLDTGAVQPADEIDAAFRRLISEGLPQALPAVPDK